MENSSCPKCNSGGTEVGPYIGQQVAFPERGWIPPIEEEEAGPIWEEVPGEEKVFEETVKEPETIILEKEEEKEEKEEPQGHKKTRQEKFVSDMRAWAKSHGFAEPTTYEEAKQYEKQKKLRERLLKEQAKTSLEEIRSKGRKYRREYRPNVGKWIKTYLKPRPSTDLAKIFFPGKALRETYLVKPPVKTTVEQIRQIRSISAPQMGLESTLGQSNIPHLEKLQSAGNPPPTPVIGTPARNPAEFEGVGPALVRLRRMGELFQVDQAVLAEVQANGDIDTPSHVRREVKRLGFSSSEIDSSLKRLRDIGFLIPSGQVHGGEKVLMLSGGSHG